jgi:hypothetical protein
MVCMPAHSRMTAVALLYSRMCRPLTAAHSAVQCAMCGNAMHQPLVTLVQMRESEKRKGSKRKGRMDDDTERHAMPGIRKPAKQGRR